MSAVQKDSLKETPFTASYKRGAFELYASRARRHILPHLPYPSPSMLMAFSPFLSLARYAALRRPFYGK